MAMARDASHSCSSEVKQELNLGCCSQAFHFPAFRYQLVYACGSQVALPARAERVGAVEAVLRLVSKLVDCGDSTQLCNDKVAKYQPASKR
jgi:hypothetical protein